ncbi:MAG: phage N-6-adenine-methyltransferase [Limnochordia bacterium]|nr:phage N-6-adenine-methyltransferase [Limnochordia bacterium]
MVSKVLFSSMSPSYATPEWLFRELDNEFNFNYDPCPISDNAIDGLLTEWGTRTFCNPPYGRNIGKWIMKGYQESRENGKLVVFLIASRTDTRWWHEYVMKAEEIRFIRGRLKFGDTKQNAPFPSCVVIFK